MVKELSEMSPESCLEMGRRFRDGNCVDMNLYKAAEWMREAVDMSVETAKNELFDILWRINTPDSLKEMISIGNKYSDAGDAEMIGRMGRAYRDGKGVSRDLRLASQYYSAAYSKGVTFAGLDLLCIIYLMGSDYNDNTSCEELLNDNRLETIVGPLMKHKNKDVLMMILSVPTSYSDGILSDVIAKSNVIADKDDTYNCCSELYSVLLYYSDLSAFNGFVNPNTISRVINTIFEMSYDAGTFSKNDRIDFFRSLPAPNETMKTIFDASSLLLRLFDEFCRLNSIRYWIAAGTLLGYVRHGGFIPWDDDVDVFMTREDLNKLRQTITDNPLIWLNEYIDHTYDKRYFRVYRIQYRTDNPIFIDIFTMDYIDESKKENWDKYLILRSKMTEDSMLIINNALDSGMDPKTKELANPIIEEYIDLTAQTLAINGENGALIWGIENYSYNDMLSPTTKSIFPLVDVTFDGTTVMSPNDPSELLRQNYGDILTFPPDALWHAHHEKIDEMHIIKSIKALMEKNDYR